MCIRDSANTHWYRKYTEANIQKETYKNVAQDANTTLQKNIEELASVKMMHDVHKNQKEKYKHGRDLYKASYDKEKTEHEELKDKYNKMKRDQERDERMEGEGEETRLFHDVGTTRKHSRVVQNSCLII